MERVRIFPHVLAYPDQNAEKSCKEEEEGGGEGEFASIEHAARQQLKTSFFNFFNLSYYLPFIFTANNILTLENQKQQLHEDISSCFQFS